MSVVLLLTERNHETYATPRRVRLRDRISARLHVHALDQALVHGTPPEASPTLALRAEALLKPAVRHRLGNQIHQVINRAHHTRQIPAHAVPIARHAIRHAEAELETLALRLLDDQPIAVRGIASARRLLHDANSPLYGTSDPAQLQDAVNTTIHALELYA